MNQDTETPRTLPGGEITNVPNDADFGDHPPTVPDAPDVRPAVVIDDDGYVHVSHAMWMNVVKRSNITSAVALVALQALVNNPMAAGMLGPEFAEQAGDVIRQLTDLNVELANLS